MIYVSDHLLDVRRGLLYSSRHKFVARHAKVFLTAVGLAFSVAFVLSLFLPRAIFLDGTGLSIAVVLYLLAIHRGRRIKRLFPKEVMVALLFAAGSTIAVWSHRQHLHAAAAALVNFAGLCLLNCVGVDTWEWQSAAERPRPPHFLIEWLGNHYFAMSFLLILGATVSLQRYPVPVLAIAGSTLSLLLVARIRHRFSAESVRLMADLCLLIVPLRLLVMRP